MEEVYKRVPANKIFQSGNGSTLVRDVVPYECITEVAMQEVPLGVEAGPG